MIRPNNRLFWLIIGTIAVMVAVLVIRPLREAFGALIWDAILVPLYASSKLLVDQRVLLFGAVLLLLIVLPFLFSPVWELLRILDNMAMALVRSYYSGRLVRYGNDVEDRRNRDPYVRLRGVIRRIGHMLRFMKHIPILSDLYLLAFDDTPSSRVALLLINRVHESSYVIALGKDSQKNRQRWEVTTASAQALIHHTLAGQHLSATTRLIGALLLDDLHSQNYVMMARGVADLSPRLPVWRQRALALYQSLTADLPADDPWSAWVTLRILWLELFYDPAAVVADSDLPLMGEVNILDWAALSIVEEQFWRLTELADNETGFGIAIAAAHRLTFDLGALTALGNSPGASDLLRFGSDLGHWIDSTADTLRATVWHQSPSSRASELSPGTFLAAQLIRGIGPKWAKPGEPASDAIRGQMIAARSAIYMLIQSGWRGMVPDPHLQQAEALAGRAADEIEIEDEFGSRA